MSCTPDAPALGELTGDSRFGLLRGASRPMQHLYRMLARVAPTDATVFLQGESGTGKELIAQTIHDLSNRHDTVFVPVNCGALPVSLIESELFGHERGSFTGASRQHKGYFERASGGTLFLDEITEMPLDLQVNLLRVIETGTLVRLGGNAEIQVDVRVIAATNRAPAEAVSEGKLREDLYFRLSAFPIRIPPLRERGEDVALLAQHFLSSLNTADGIEKRLTPQAMSLLETHDWPGNVRELKNSMQRAYILADEVIDSEHFPQRTSAPADNGGHALDFSVGTTIDDAERRLILATLEHFNGDKRRAADTLGISLKTIYNRLKRYQSC